MNPRLRPTPFVLALAALATSSIAAEPAEPAVPTVTITGSVKERVVGDAPFAISVVGRDELRSAGPQVNLSEALARVPGLVVGNRSNFAQDLQISSRGFGARAGFGVRGIRLLQDGIPASGPDGQGQVSQFDLAGAERVEVLRGPFSVLYGNSSGGVISLITAPVRRFEAEGGIDIGSAGLQQLRAGVAVPLGGGFSAKVSASEFKVDGFRPHSAAHRELGNVRLGWAGEADSVTVLAGIYRQPAQDPLGLSRDQFNLDPLMVTPQAVQFDTRKESAQEQLGAIWKHRFAEGALRDVQLMGYRGQRAVTQWLAITAATQGTAGTSKHGGGVVDFDRDFQGAELRARWAWDGIDLQAGAALDAQTDDRRGYENYTGTPAAPVYGGIGKPRRDETNKARTSDVFGQAEFALGAGLTTSAGLRSGRVKLSAEDRYLSNGDDSGAMSFSYTNPVLGLRWQAAPGWQLHASLARGFESPTLGELAYRADGSSGINFGLKPQKSRQAEIGSKWRSGALEADVALFQAKVSDEIGVATNAGGRSAFQNVGRTLRRGGELAGGWLPASGLRGRVALTVLSARYEDDFLTCAGLPCNAPTLKVPAGNAVAGAQRRSAYGELGWRLLPAAELALEVRGSGRTAVNDANTDFAGGYGLAALRYSHALVATSATRVELLLRVDNLFDRRYAGSVIVGDANGRYFETGAPRAFLLALRITGGG